MDICKVQGCRFKNSHVTSHHICGSCGKLGHGMVECGNKKLIKNLQKFGKDLLSDEHKCEVITCKDKHYHTTSGHFCRVCKKGFHKETECPFVLIESREKFNKSVMNELRYTLPNRSNWGLNYDCLSLIEEIITNDYKLKFKKQVEKCYYNQMVNDSDYGNFDFYKTIVRKNIKKGDENLYFEFDAGMGCGVAIRVNKYHLPLTSFFLHSDCQGQYGEATNHIPMYNNFIKGCEFKLIKNKCKFNY